MGAGQLLPDRTIAAAPSPVVFRSSAARVAPIEGTDYSAVPTRRAGPLVRDRLAAELSGKWLLQRVRTPAGRPKRHALHYEGCWLARGEAILTLDQALHALVEGAESCDGCEAQRLHELRIPQIARGRGTAP